MLCECSTNAHYIICEPRGQLLLPAQPPQHDFWFPNFWWRLMFRVLILGLLHPFSTAVWTWRVAQQLRCIRLNLKVDWYLFTIALNWWMLSWFCLIMTNNLAPIEYSQRMILAHFEHHTCNYIQSLLLFLWFSFTKTFSPIANSLSCF